MVFPPRLGSDPALWADRPQFLEEGLNRGQGDLWWSERFQENLRNYHSMIRGIDDAVGAIRSALAERKLDRQTVIFFLSDNGFYRGERRRQVAWARCIYSCPVHHLRPPTKFSHRGRTGPQCGHCADRARARPVAGSRFHPGQESRAAAAEQAYRLEDRFLCGAHLQSSRPPR